MLTLALFSTPFLGVACAPADEAATHESEAPALSSLNGLTSVNGLSSVNGLTSVNGLSSLNGLTSVNGLSSVNGLITTAGGRDTIKYIVRCALPAGRSITKTFNGTPYNFAGQIGVAPEWENGACSSNCQQHVSACVLAHVNTTGQNIALWLDGDSPALGWGQSSSYPQQEGSFFGNIFVSPPTMYYCNGKDFDVGVVPGRIGAGTSSGPYTNPIAGAGFCKDGCTPQDAPNQNDGYKACHGFNHVVTVWRNSTGSNSGNASTSFSPTTDYKICSRFSGKCLDVNGGSTANYATIVQNTYSSSSTSMRWKITQVSTGKYTFTNKKSGKVIDVSGGGTANGTPLIQYAYIGANNQQWTIVPIDSSYYHFNAVHKPTSVVDLTNFATNNGAPTTLWAYTGVNNQQWSIVPAN